jgi:hypothetical protein
MRMPRPRPRLLIPVRLIPPRRIVHGGDERDDQPGIDVVLDLDLPGLPWPAPAIPSGRRGAGRER